MDEQMIVPSRFRGPASSGNGGWTAGALAAHVRHESLEDRTDPWPAISVSLRRPPPLDTPMPVTHEDGEAVASYDDVVVARARVVDGEGPGDVEAVPADEARAAMASYPGLSSHPFPTCFACGTGRAVGDGLRIFPGRVADQDEAVRIAAAWTPDESVSEDWHVYVDDVRHASLPVTWAALDCVGGWAGDLTERLMVLAAMTARVDALPVIGEEHVVVGLARGREGRKTFTASTLYDSDGRIVACAEHVWVAVDPATFA
ncbi:hypothetical protein [Nocardioides sp.]|uniref:hypothetical protein n=1 Tax=Nocardioides sp. TaxID=35761 RepID=UPI0031FE8E3A